MMVATHRQILPEEEELPPTYTPFPRPEEQSIDAGAGAPIVRAQTTHLVVNPSDPRSHYARHFYGSNNIPSLPPRRARAPGPIPVDPLLPPRLNAGYEQMETPPHLTPRAQPSLTQLTQFTPSAGAVGNNDECSPLNRPVTTGVFQNAPPGPSVGNVSYSTLRENPTSVRVVQGQGHWSQRHYGDSALSSWPARPHNSDQQHYALASGSSTPTVITVNCPNCRNTGWLGPRTSCTCPLGMAAKNKGPRSLQSSLIGILEDILTPGTSHYGNNAYSSHSSHNPHTLYPNQHSQHSPQYAHLIPGTGSLCPNCLGRSYFRSSEMQGHPATREMERQFGSLPPPCSVCCDHGRLR